MQNLIHGMFHLQNSKLEISGVFHRSLILCNQSSSEQSSSSSVRYNEHPDYSLMLHSGTDTSSVCCQFVQLFYIIQEIQSCHCLTMPLWLLLPRGRAGGLRLPNPSTLLCLCPTQNTQTACTKLVSRGCQAEDMVVCEMNKKLLVLRDRWVIKSNMSAVSVPSLGRMTPSYSS